MCLTSKQRRSSKRDPYYLAKLWSIGRRTEAPGINRRQQRRPNASLHLDGWARRVPAILPMSAFSLSAAIAYTGTFDFPASDFEIMNAEGTQVIGHGYYEISRGSNGYATAFGEDHFNDGEFDIECDKLELRSDDQVPRMVTF